MIFQGPGRPNRVLAELSELILDPTVTRLRVGVAYANRGGVEALQTLVAAANHPVEVEVVVALDMGITRKAALDMLLRDYGGNARAITTTSPGTFHAKAFVVDREGDSQRAVVGSANLTAPALTQNREAVAVTDLGPAEEAEWEEWWADLVAASEELTQEVIDNYEERRPHRGRRERIADEDIETQDDGSTVAHIETSVGAEEAGWLVIDWGGTGEYRVQAEFPKTAAAFFRPDVDVDRTMITLRHEGRDYADNLLRYYRDNGMVRINLDADIPFVADGSIKDGACLFARLDEDHYELRPVDLKERAHHLIEAASKGERDFTTKHDGTRREFGWV